MGEECSRGLRARAKGQWPGTMPRGNGTVGGAEWGPSRALGQVRWESCTRQSPVREKSMSLCALRLALHLQTKPLFPL